MRNISNEKRVDPSVKWLTMLFPEDWAFETGFIQRERKIDPVILFWVIVLGFGGQFSENNTWVEKKI